jgi:predicted transcriptional regulator
LEKITIEVDSEVEINQRDLDKLDYIVEELNRGLHNAIEVIDALGQSVSRYENQSAAMRDGIDKIRANAAAEGRELTDDEQRQIWDYEDQLLDINRSLYDLMDTVDEQVLAEF